MTPDRQDNIENAAEIIERFGGIRPMAAKMGVAVTTIQGWKQRNSIPAARKDDLISAAKVHGVSLDGLAGFLPQGAVLPPSGTASSQAQPAAAVLAEKNISIEKPARASASEASSTSSADSKPVAPPVAMPSHKATYAAAAVLIFAAAAIGVVFAIAPKVTDQQRRIAELEQQVAELQKEETDQGASSLVPAEYQRSLAELQTKVGQIAEQADSYKAMVTSLQHDLQSGDMQQRMAKIEGHIQSLVAQAKASGLQDMINRVQMMQQSPDGAAELGNVVGSLVQSLPISVGEGNEEAMVAAFEQLKATDPQVAATFKDVAPEDMKAAIMLVGMSQLRSSLARDNDSFDTDLTLLKATMAKDDPALAEAIDRLAPRAKEGVLTPEGLSTEFRSLTGEIVAASLSGQNVSVEDKVLARVGTLVKVEKNGQPVSGTDTQIAVAKAQKLLDEGKVEEAVAILQQLQGPAAEKTQPFIAEAEATMMARQVQQMLGTSLIYKLKGLTQRAPSGAYINSGGGLNSMVNEFKSFAPGPTPKLPYHPSSGGN